MPLSLINVTYQWPISCAGNDWSEMRKLMLAQKDRVQLIADIISWLSCKGYLSIIPVRDVFYAESILFEAGTSKVMVWTGGNELYNDLDTLPVHELHSQLGLNVFSIICTNYVFAKLNPEDVPINVAILTEGQMLGPLVRSSVFPAFVVNLCDSGITTLSRHAELRAEAIKAEFDVEAYDAKNLSEFRHIVSIIELNS